MAASSEEVQLVVNSESVKNASMDCYANYNFQINVPVKDTIGKEPVKEPEPPKPEAKTGYVHLSGRLLSSKDDGGWYVKVFESQRDSAIISVEPGEVKEFSNVNAQIMGGNDIFFLFGLHKRHSCYRKP